MQRGLLQGLPECPALFSATIEGLLRDIRCNADAFTLDGSFFIVSPNYFDDLYLVANALEPLMRQLHRLRNAMASAGMCFSTTKCSFSTTQRPAPQTLVLRDLNSTEVLHIPISDKLPVFNIPVTIHAVDTKAAWTQMLGKAWASYWMVLPWLRTAGTLDKRLDLLDLWVASSFLWAASILPTCQSTRQMIRVAQQAMVIKIFQWKRRPAEGWLDWHIRCHRQARTILAARRWDRTAALRHLEFAGHLCRADSKCSLAAVLLKWRSLGWWRRAQASQSASTRPRHALGAVATWQNRWDRACDEAIMSQSELLRDEFIGRVLDWTAVARNRDLWKLVCRGYAGSLD